MVSDVLKFNKFKLKCQQWYTGSYCTSVIVGSRVYSNTLAALFTHYPTVWNQSIGCAVAWFTIARNSESECPFHCVGQFCRVRAGHLWCQMYSSLTNLSLSVSSGSYSVGVIVGSRVYSNTLVTLFTHYLIVWAAKCSVVGTRVLAVLQRGLLQHVTLNLNIHSILWGNSAGFGQVAYFLP